MLSARSLGIPEISRYVNVARVEEDEVARGGVADVYPGFFQQSSAPIIKVAIKTIRVSPQQLDSSSASEKLRKKLNRELGVWRILQGEFGHPNLLRLLGVIDSPDGIPSSVSEFCTATLAEYLINPVYKPQRLKLLVGTLNGLAYMHGFSIVHGDLKGLNILVTRDGTPKICDFGHARFVNDTAQPIVSDISSKFHATTRYMSPELFSGTNSKPTLFSDVWAFGCVALEILSQLRPYHAITNEHRVTVAIKSGRTPSTKPGRPYAASCLTDALWDIIKACWHPHQLSRPTSTTLLHSINDLIEKGELDLTMSTPAKAARDIEELQEWPEEIRDFAQELSKLNKTRISMQRMADVWKYYTGDASTGLDSRKSNTSRMYAVKVLRAPIGLGSDKSIIDPLQQALRRAVWERASIKHPHIVEVLGLDTSYGRYPGLVMDFQEGGTLRDVLDAGPLGDEDFCVKCMLQILKGLQFLHNLPSPLAHGDLTPHNILADRNGTLKLTLISFARLSADLPSNTQTVVPNDDVISARYFSPELVANDDGVQPNSQADMWSFGCVACWMYVRVDPYPECKLEHEVISSIIEAIPPYTVSQLSRIRELGGYHIMPHVPWITNGTLSTILRCWNQDGSRRPTADACLRDFGNLLDKFGQKQTSIPPDVRNITERISTPAQPRKQILGSITGTWRRIFNYKGGIELDLRYWWWRGIYSPGLLRRSIEVNIKAVQLVPRVRSGHLFEAATQSIYHEIGLLRQFNHDNICTFYGYDDLHGGTLRRSQVPAIITEFCSNGTLTEFCSKRSSDLSFQDRLNLLKDLAGGIVYIHTQIPQGSVAHGNLSTDTVHVDKNGKAKLTRFEFACQYEHSDISTTARIIDASHIALTPSRWHPPELFNDSADTMAPFPTIYGDLWALGCILVAVMSNQAPYEKYDLPGAISCITEGTKPYSEYVCVASIWELANMLWEKQPHERASAELVLKRLSGI